MVLKLVTRVFLTGRRIGHDDQDLGHFLNPVNHIKREVRSLADCLKEYLFLWFIKAIGPFLDVVNRLPRVLVIGLSIGESVGQLYQLRQKGLLTRDGVVATQTSAMCRSKRCIWNSQKQRRY